MIRESIARHTGAAPAAEPGAPSYAAHAAFVRLPLPQGGDQDGMCIIEPSVRCTHCG